MAWRPSSPLTLAIPIALATLLLAAEAGAQACGPGETKIGEDADFIYCSKLTCAQLEGQVARDQDAIKRLQQSILASNAELKEWAAKNQAAADKAREDATNFLVSSVLGAFAQMGEQTIATVEKEFRRRSQMFGQTWDNKIRLVQEMESRRKRLLGAVHGFKLLGFPGMNLNIWWDATQKWAAETKHEGDAIAAIMAALESDPQAREIMTENGLAFVSDSLKLGLKSFAGSALSFGEFLVNYGYDATAWWKSKTLIEQNVLNQERNRIAVCRLGVRLETTVRNRNICHGRMPAKNSVPPDLSRCK